MKKILLFLLLSFSFLPNQAQILTPAKWHFETSKKEIKAGETLDLIFYADIDAGWYLYSSDFDPELGPQVTTITIEPDASYQLVGKLKPVGAKKKYSDVFEGEYTYFTKKAEFRQTVKILKANPVLKGTYDYQVCTEKDGKCVPGKGKFEFKDIKVASVENNTSVQPQKTDIKPDITKATEKQDTVQTAANTEDNTPKDKNSSEINNPELITDATKDKAEVPLWQFLLESAGFGLLALLMPCIFPLIPMTVTFFTKQSHSKAEAIRKIGFYGLSIILIYTIIGVIFSSIFGATSANWLSSHWLPNTLIFIVLVIFAMSFLGMFEITAPNSWANAADQQADKGGYYGIFFMALTLVLVSFSCTIPIVGTNLVRASQGEFFRPTLGMIAFSSALAIPFMLFAAFPSWLQNLPKSGSWLNSIKVVLGFLELAFAFKFLSQVDVVYNWHFLDRGVFLAIWIVIFTLMGFYLLGKLQLPHDNKTEKVPVPRLMLSIIVFSFVIYMIPGLFGAPLNLLSAYLPPYQNFDLYNNYRTITNTQLTSSENNTKKVKYSEYFESPHGIQSFFDYQEGLSYAKKVNKPVFIDFTGWSCANCRVMEKNVWADPEVLKRLKNEYIVLALYVDDRHELPVNEQFTSSFDKEIKKTIGDKNADFQITKFNNNAQPYYCLLNHEGNLLLPPKGLDLDVNNFIKFLDEGVKNFKDGKSLNAPTALK
jgi:thiol:disulfide interchange protein DsbD